MGKPVPGTCRERSIRGYANDRLDACQSAQLGGRERGEQKQAAGRSRGGRNTKIHALADTKGRLIAILLTGGEAHDCPLAERPIRRVKLSKHLLGDKAYDSAELRSELDEKTSLFGVACANTPSISPVIFTLRWQQRLKSASRVRPSIITTALSAPYLAAVRPFLSYADGVTMVLLTNRDATGTDPDSRICIIIPSVATTLILLMTQLHINSLRKALRSRRYSERHDGR